MPAVRVSARSVPISTTRPAINGSRRHTTPPCGHLPSALSTQVQQPRAATATARTANHHAHTTADVMRPPPHVDAHIAQPIRLSEVHRLLPVPVSTRRMEHSATIHPQPSPIIESAHPERSHPLCAVPATLHHDTPDPLVAMHVHLQPLVATVVTSRPGLVRVELASCVTSANPVVPPNA